MARAKIIEIKNLKKVYAGTKESTLALEDLSFDVYDQEFVSIIGPSGCGKSTLLRLVAGLIPKTEGEIILNGIPIMGPRRDIGIVFQDPTLLPWRTNIANVLLPIEVYKLDVGKYRKEAVDLLEFTGLKGFVEKYPHELSGGMKQRVSLSRALIHDPTLLLLDEPFGALDALTREKLDLELLRIWQQKKKTVLFVTHSIPEAIFLADRVVVLTPRPGKVNEIIEIELKRLRKAEVKYTKKFREYIRRLEKLLVLPT